MPAENSKVEDDTLRFWSKVRRNSGDKQAGWAFYEVYRLRKIVRGMLRDMGYPEDKPKFPHFVGRWLRSRR